eukprot:TRINITY_DN4089_c0_g1_i1.p1 TRINITY_DN4089_c0_g1~~TRINITY_DN4089_c0_g1_i1.p1  ORF type:complete len:342 (+),score=49.80 TRINITY_DN4089_c0_g1_i1:68-1093(+)
MRHTRLALRNVFADTGGRSRPPGIGPDIEFARNKFTDKNGYAKTYNFEAAMPGIGSDNHVADDVSMRHSWFNELNIPHGSHKGAMPRLPKRRHLADGPVGGMLDNINDAAGFPTSSNLSKAASWKVERLARVNSDYELTKQPVKTPVKKPAPLGIQPVCAARSQRAYQPSRWKNYLTNVKGSSPDPLVRDAKDQRTFAPRLSESIDKRMSESEHVKKRMRSGSADRPWETNRDSMNVDIKEDAGYPLSMKTDPFGSNAMQNDATAVWIFGWANEWETQIKIACPWDNRLYVHRTSAELPWVLEQQWNTPEVARDLTKDCIEDFQELFQKKGYMKGYVCYIL